MYTIKTGYNKHKRNTIKTGYVTNISEKYN